jgi:hypothetical protein
MLDCLTFWANSCVSNLGQRPNLRPQRKCGAAPARCARPEEMWSPRREMRWLMRKPALDKPEQALRRCPDKPQRLVSTSGQRTGETGSDPLTLCFCPTHADIALFRLCSCVSVLQGGDAVVIADAQGNRRTPSCVAFTATRCLAGEAAMNQAERNPESTVYGVKRLIGRKFSEQAVHEEKMRMLCAVQPGADDVPLIQGDLLHAARDCDEPVAGG